VKKLPGSQIQFDCGDNVYSGCLTLKADFVKFFCASPSPGRKSSFEGKGGKKIKQPFHPERRYLLVSYPADPSNSILILHPHNSRALWSLTSVFKPLYFLASLAESTQTLEKCLKERNAWLF